MKPYLRFWAILSCFLAGGLPLLAGDDPAPEEGTGREDGGDGADEGDGPGDEDSPPIRVGPTEREEKVLSLFSATDKKFNDGKLTLIYDFKSKDDPLLADWKPTLEQARPRVRWSLPQEGPLMSGLDEEGFRIKYYRGCLVLADNGQLLHKAVFLSEAAMTVRLCNMAQPRSGTIFAPVFYNEKRKAALGANGGCQLVILKGARPANARSPIPVMEQPLPRSVVFQIGYRYSKGVLEALKDERMVIDTSGSPKFAEGFETGRTGIAWNGSVQCFVLYIVIEGKLDPDWVSRELKETKK